MEFAMMKERTRKKRVKTKLADQEAAEKAALIEKEKTKFRTFICELYPFHRITAIDGRYPERNDRFKSERFFIQKDGDILCYSNIISGFHNEQIKSRR